MFWPNLFISSALAVIVGIFSAASNFNFYLVFLVFGVLVWLIGGYFSKTKNFNFQGIFLIPLIFLGLGFFYYHFFVNFSEIKLKIDFGKEIQFSGVVLNEPNFLSKYQTFLIKLEPPYQGEIKVLASLAPKFRYGDLIKFNGQIERGERVYEKSISFFPQTEFISAGNGFWLKQILFKFKEKQIEHFRNFLPVNQAALISGETFGFRGDFTEEFKEKMSLSGTTHIVALSGYNIAILILVIGRLLTNFFKRRIRFWLIILGVIFFVVMVGGEASVVRAAIMGFLVLFAREIGRPTETFRIIVLAALVMIIINPYILKYDLGFQLSFLSLLGIVYIEPFLNRLLKFDQRSPSFLSWRENAVTTFSAQLAVVPMLIQNFDLFSITSILANILILEVVPFSMFLGFLAGGLSLVWTGLGFLAVKLLGVILAYQVMVIEIFSVLVLPIKNIFFSKILIIAYYGVLIFFLLWNQGGKLKNTFLNYERK